MKCRCVDCWNMTDLRSVSVVLEEVCICCTSSPLITAALKNQARAYTTSPNTPGSVVASGTNCGAFTKLLLGSQNKIPCHRCGRGVLIQGNEHRVNKGCLVAVLTGNAMQGTRLGVKMGGLGGREETIMTSFNSLSLSLSNSAPRQRLERNAQFQNRKSPLNMGAFGLSVSCCNKNVCQVCEPRFLCA